MANCIAQVTARFQHGRFKTTSTVFRFNRPDGGDGAIIFVKAPPPPASLGMFMDLECQATDGAPVPLRLASEARMLDGMELRQQVRAALFTSVSLGRSSLLALLFPDLYGAATPCNGVIDMIEYGANFIAVAGWMAVPRGMAWPEEVAIRIGGRCFPLTHWFSRSDLPERPDGPRMRAFFQDFAWPENEPPQEEVWLERDGQVLAAAQAARWLPFAPRGYLDGFSQAEVSGWIYDPGLWHSGGRAFLRVEGAGAVELPLTVSRPDLPFFTDQQEQKLGFCIGTNELAEAFASSGLFGKDEVRRWSLVASGTVVHAGTATLPAISHGKLERYGEGAVKGWAGLRGYPNSNVMVEILIDGARYATIRASRPRRDLQSKGIVNQGGGFALPLHWSPSASSSIRIEARVLGEQRLLRGSPLEVTDLPVRTGTRVDAWRELAARRLRVSVIIPVYNAPEELEHCLASVVAQTGQQARIIVIDDASPDPRVAEVLRRFRRKAKLRIVTNRRNLGFTRTCNKGIRLAGGDDVVLLNSDTVVPARWLENLMVAAYAAPDIASATPLSNNAGAFSAPLRGQANPLPDGLGATDASRLVAQCGLALFPEVPTGHGFCLYLKRSALDSVGVLDSEAFPRGYGEENDLCMRALRAGFRHVLDDRTYVQHRQSASFGEAKGALLAEGRAVLDRRYPEYTHLVRGFSGDETMRDLRWRIGKAFQAAEGAPRPRVLFVISTASGGTPQTNLDLMRALEDRYEPWLLRCDSQVLELQRLRGGTLEGVSTTRLEQPVRMIQHRSPSYTEAVASLLVRHAIELVHVRHIAWHGLDLPEVAQALGIPVVFSLHDFYAVCPTIKLLDEALSYCGGQCSAAQGECRAELWPTEQTPPLRGRFLHRWRQMLEPALRACDAFVTTSEAARGVITGAYPLLAERDFRVIQHGRSFEAFLAPRPLVQLEGPLRVLVPGNISAAKGARIIQAIAALDGGASVEFHILGDSGTLQPGPGIVIHGKYERGEFTGKVDAIGPHMGAILSVWPETYCHTLTELWASGLAVFALDFGAVGERIRAHGGGWLANSQDPAELLQRLVALVQEPAAIERRVAEVAAWQRSEGLLRDVEAMAADYDRLYREVTHARLTVRTGFRPPAEWLLVDGRAAGGPVPPALANRADGRILFRKLRPAALPLALEAAGPQGVVVLADRLEDGLVVEAAELCAKLRLCCLLCPGTAPDAAALEGWARRDGVMLGLLVGSGEIMAMPAFNLSLSPLDAQERLAGFAAMMAKV
jgi:GT2 family glycosyltransferase/glycosyltransferase involved in cell wall biosynthesis